MNRPFFKRSTDKKIMGEIDYIELRRFLKSLSYRSIKEGALVTAHTRDDVDFFCKTDKQKRSITLDQVIEYGQPFLVDALGNDLSVCVLTRRRYKLPNGRVVAMKLDRTIIDDCRTVFGSPINGLFVIPCRFIKRSQKQTSWLKT